MHIHTYIQTRSLHIHLHTPIHAYIQLIHTYICIHTDIDTRKHIRLRTYIHPRSHPQTWRRRADEFYRSRNLLSLSYMDIYVYETCLQISPYPYADTRRNCQRHRNSSHVCTCVCIDTYERERVSRRVYFFREEKVYHSVSEK